MNCYQVAIAIKDYDSNQTDYKQYQINRQISTRSQICNSMIKSAYKTLEIHEKLIMTLLERFQNSQIYCHFGDRDRYKKRTCYFVT